MNNWKNFEKYALDLLHNPQEIFDAKITNYADYRISLRVWHFPTFGTSETYTIFNNVAKTTNDPMCQRVLWDRRKDQQLISDPILSLKHIGKPYTQPSFDVSIKKIAVEDNEQLWKQLENIRLNFYPERNFFQLDGSVCGIKVKTAVYDLGFEWNIDAIKEGKDLETNFWNLIDCMRNFFD